MTNSASENVGFEKRKQLKNWFNNICKEAVDKRNELRRVALQNLSTSATDRYETQRKIANKIVRREKRLYEKKMIEDREINSCHPKIVFNMSGNIKRGYKSQTIILTDVNGTLITDEKQIANKFKDFFNNLLNRLPHNNENKKIEYHTVEPKIEKPTQNKIDAAVGGLKNNNASGDDGLFAELLKRGGLLLRKKLTEMIGCVWKIEQIPDDWNTAIICPTYKKERVVSG